MRKFLSVTLFVLLTAFSALPSFSQTEWFLQNSGVNRHLLSVSFPNELTGYACGYTGLTSGTLVKTTDGGANWFTLTSPTRQTATLVHFFNESTGIISGYDINGTGITCKTTNGGLNWAAPVVTDFAGYSVAFTSSLVGYLVGGNLFDGMSICKTLNAGNSWGTTVELGGSLDGLSSVAFANANTGVIFGKLGASYRTTNGSTSWNQLTDENVSYRNYAAQFINETTGFNCGRNGFLGKTTNAGINWSYARPLGATDTLFALKFTSHKVGYLLGEGSIILQTTDGAVTWEPLASPSGNTLHAVSFPSPQVGYAVGDNGTIIKTITGVLTGVTPVNAAIPGKFNLYQNYPNPFNPSTKIKFDISSPGFTTIKVFDSNGKQVDELFSERISAGSYEVNFSGERLSSGVYYYKIETGNFTQTKKMILMK
jgi:photosystem II stability/assembly factor-like uncharacterized protein